MEKKGLSQVVGTVVLILVTLALIGSLWAVINSFINNRMDSAKACQKINTIYLDSEYTCYNQSGYTVFSLGVNNGGADGILISADYGGTSKTFTLTNKLKSIANLSYYDPAKGVQLGNVSMPDPESAVTYAINIPSKPDSIEVAAKVNGKLCGVSDSVNNIGICS